MKDMILRKPVVSDAISEDETRNSMAEQTEARYSIDASSNVKDNIPAYDEDVAELEA